MDAAKCAKVFHIRNVKLLLFLNSVSKSFFVWSYHLYFKMVIVLTVEQLVMYYKNNYSDWLTKIEV